MVQLKYFGDDRDFFKYDLLSSVLSENIFATYGFVPMLTFHREDGEGNITPRHINGKSGELYRFISACPNRDLNHWQKWMQRFSVNYQTIQPVNETFFRHHTRANYWQKFKDIINSDYALIFFDPDTGLQAGRKSTIKPGDEEKYILNQDLLLLTNKLASTSVYVIYQHLQRNRNKREEDIIRKITALRESYVGLQVSVYYENDLSFFFLSKEDVLHSKINSILAKYYRNSTVKQKNVFLQVTAA
ncbi:MAG: hypothetical protein KJ950_13760 [Proteobacteria bacterium]|nr:hypothetical protein [Pseudomonadota bacterium]MBU1686075.1 hypothetical protein [Pseudomonadota bacterium]